MTTKERWESMSADERYRYWWRMAELGGLFHSECRLAWEELYPLTRACLKNIQPEKTHDHPSAA